MNLEVAITYLVNHWPKINPALLELESLCAASSAGSSASSSGTSGSRATSTATNVAVDSAGDVTPTKSADPIPGIVREVVERMAGLSGDLESYITVCHNVVTRVLPTIETDMKSTIARLRDEPPDWQGVYDRLSSRCDSMETDRDVAADLAWDAAVEACALIAGRWTGCEDAMEEIRALKGKWKP